MNNALKRMLALVLCLSLTLGAFVYRPPEAKAVAVVDDAVVIGALLTAFSAGCGLIFANNGMTSNEIAQGMTQKWNEFKNTLSTVPSSFASWLGYNSTEELLASCVIVGPSKMNITRPIARKFAEFTDWLTKDLGVTPSGEEKPVVSHSAVKFYKMRFETGLGYLFDTEMSVSLSSRESDAVYSLGTPICSFYDLPKSKEDAAIFGFSDRSFLKVYRDLNDNVWCYSSTYGNWAFAQSAFVDDAVDGNIYLLFSPSQSFGFVFEAWQNVNGERVKRLLGLGSGVLADENLQTYEERLAAYLRADGLRYPSLDTPAEGTEEAPIAISGVGADATTIEELLQQILAQLQANTLAPSLEVAGTETGGNTGTDEDAKPYLPYIPRIFEKIKELPGTLANIWESIKGIPAAIAEKIGAFFTTLWGWLQNIIDAITALPAAIAEKIGALFKPDEALLTEITDTFKGKFGFFSTLKQFGSDLFGMTPETEPPVIWVHLENAESKFGYNYGDKQKIFDMTWYQKYKASVDGLLSGFLWLGYLWLLFKRAPAILNGMQLSNDEARASADVSSVPRLGSGDGFYLGGKRE